MQIDREDIMRRLRSADKSTKAAIRFRGLESTYLNAMGSIMAYGEYYEPSEIYAELVSGSIAKERMDRLEEKHDLVIAQDDHRQRAGGYVRYNPREHLLDTAEGVITPKKGEVVLIENSAVAIRENGKLVTLFEQVVRAVPGEFQTPELPIE